VACVFVVFYGAFDIPEFELNFEWEMKTFAKRMTRACTNKEGKGAANREKHPENQLSYAKNG
jgi:hypothetical protein